MKRNPFIRRPIPPNFKRPHSKAEEPDPATAGFRRNLPSIQLRHSLQGGGEIITVECYYFYFSDLTLWVDRGQVFELSTFHHVDHHGLYRISVLSDRELSGDGLEIFRCSQSGPDCLSLG
jgi:hypothetical protein